MKKIKEFVLEKIGEGNAVVINIASILFLTAITFGLLIVLGTYFSY